MGDVNLTDTFDANVWVEEWMKTIKKHPKIPTDEGAMLGWFANAIMAGYDAGRREDEEQDHECEPEGSPAQYTGALDAFKEEVDAVHKAMDHLGDGRRFQWKALLRDFEIVLAENKRLRAKLEEQP